MSKILLLENLSYFKTKQDSFNAGKFIDKSAIGKDIPSLSGGKIPLSQIPASAITDTFVVSSLDAMLALKAETGDVAVRTDLSKSFILKADNPTVTTNWQELLTPDSKVTSVNGQQGAVVIADATTNNSGLMSAPDKTKLNGLSNYTLPTASSSTLGGIKVGNHLTISNGVLSGSAPYTHPDKHPASVITQDASNRFVTDSEKSTWNAKASTAVATTTANGLMSKDDKIKLDKALAGTDLNYASNTDIDGIF